MKKDRKESTEKEDRILPSKALHTLGKALTKEGRMRDPLSFLEAGHGKGSYTNISHQAVPCMIQSHN